MKVFLARFSQTAYVVAGFHACIFFNMVHMVAEDPYIHRRCDCAKKKGWHGDRPLQSNMVRITWVGAETDHYGITWVGAETDHYGITWLE